MTLEVSPTPFVDNRGAYFMFNVLAYLSNAARQDTLLSAYALHPERFVRKAPEPPLLPREAWINPSPVREMKKPQRLISSHLAIAECYL